MQSKLILVLQAQQARWIYVDEHGSPGARQEVLFGEPVDFPKAEKIIVLVPAQDVLLVQPILPKMNRSKLMQALPYALEEQLVEEVDALHFAVGAHQADGSISVAIVAHAKMQQWMAILASWHLHPDLMIPLTMALPLKLSSQWLGMIEEVSVIRTGEYTGFACDNANLAGMLDIALSSSDHLPTSIELQNYTHTPIATQLDLGVQVNETLLPAASWLADIARHVDEAPSINLLQANYVVKKPRLQETKRLLQISTGLAALFGALLFLYPTISYLILHSKVAAIEDQINAIYMLNFPQATSIVDPKLRLEDKLKTVTQQATKNRILILMGYTGKALADNENVKLNRLDYQANAVSLQLTAITTDDFNKFVNALTQQGLAVRQQNATLAAGRVNATLVIQ